ncbi:MULTISPECIES: tRNA (adenosine(37)-N6)-threonylcarbamoyltransferase complex dimerization subunit type 1 TsaB [unclassified Francisella]|uniref:tRNA (adenosine(37)-N6)-threonylcarbamoyltransferase complex dimerization subunit type 1 TsaB n=1 Tax=unclassified Francisella TaxID=2610885 RepID=UPI002E355358|nr:MULTISPECIES: tRNA (adenosine(37)-N6)-threonylcarbamoyltransferase complex dimerization subunit type 1 TsaB [unclassified Francisella]MED7819111.1 tRNA (adenosine(37)-N6)-threonylcarbamoyltransferase complex dimerization subunit type 1 TsaB [Francisella sp. 19S2-4]MED7829929.1 tRNA (adenosine(37)-N6)-threonylcarbamoyltransferase complex dimerization subunit type 1 TsaB [Francisella sp. 19S2-10]
MNFLVLDTSSRYCSVALSVNGIIYNDTREIPRQHNKYLLEMIKGVFEKANVDKKSLDFIAYGVGPGSFVGVRLAAAVCQGFAVGLDIPIIGFSSMFTIAKSTKGNLEKIAVILDARMGDFYLGLYNIQEDKIISENVHKLEEYSQYLHEGYRLVGDSIAELNIQNDDFKLDVGNIVGYVSDLYTKQKSQGKLTQEVFPIYLRGTSHWKTKE